MKISLINKESKYIVAVSGGPDSMFLLDNVYKYLGANNIFVCTVNYQKRNDSYKDVEIVKNYCESRHIIYKIYNVNDNDYKHYGKTSHNFQDIARKIRYDFFLQQCYINNCEAVLVAHNLTDHVETYLMQKKRNNIVEHFGLAESSYYHSHNKKLKIIRIMLDTSRETIIDYLNSNQISYALDYTNELDIYQRNIIRKQIDHTNIDGLLQEIVQKNKKLDLLRSQAQQFLKNNNESLNVKQFKEIENQIIRQMILYNFFKIHHLEELINNKKKNFLAELDKQICSAKPNIITKINSQYCLVKSYTHCFLKSNLDIKVWNIKLDKLNTDYCVHGKTININIVDNSSDNLGKNNVQFFNDLPIFATNDQSIYSKLKIGNKKFNRILIKHKINFLERIKNFVIYDKNYNIIYLSKCWSKSIHGYLNKSIDASTINHFNKTLYFVIK